MAVKQHHWMAAGIPQKAYDRRVSYELLRSEQMGWRATNVLGAENVDLGICLGISTFGARLWRFHPGQASLSHRHQLQEELYVLLEGAGRIRVDDDVLTLRPIDALLVGVDAVRQIFNDTGVDQLWLVVGAPREHFKIPELTDEQRAYLYPGGLDALPPELRSDPSAQRAEER